MKRRSAMQEAAERATLHQGARRQAPIDDDIRNVETVGLIGFVNAEPRRHSEYIRVFADRDRNQIRFYRLLSRVGEEGPRDWVRTIIPDARIHINTDQLPEPDAYNLHWTDAQTVITLLTALAKEQSPANVTWEYWEDSGKEKLENSKFREESLFLRYVTRTDRLREIHIANVYEIGVEVNMLARHD